MINKAILLVGGRGTRLAELTKNNQKQMIKNQKPLNYTAKIQRKNQVKTQKFQKINIMFLVILWTMRMMMKTLTKKLMLKEKNKGETEEKKKSKCHFIRQQWIF